MLKNPENIENNPPTIKTILLRPKDRQQTPGKTNRKPPETTQKKNKKKNITPKNHTDLIKYDYLVKQTENHLNPSDIFRRHARNEPEERLHEAGHHLQLGPAFRRPFGNEEKTRGSGALLLVLEKLQKKTPVDHVSLMIV